METLWFPFPTGMLSLHYGDTSVPPLYMNALTSLWRHFGPSTLQECSFFTMETLLSPHQTGMLLLHYGDTLVPFPTGMLSLHYGDTLVSPPYMNVLT
jgi:hypothetical protein